MDLLASFPLSRRRILREKVLAIAHRGHWASWRSSSCGWVVTVPFANLGSDLPRWDLVVATFAQLPFTAFIVAAGLLFGAVAPSRSTAAATTAGLLIASYLFVLFAALDDSVESLQYVSPYYYADLSGHPLEWHRSWVTRRCSGRSPAVTGWLALRGVEGREYGSERWQLGAVLRTQYRAATAPEDDAHARPRLRVLSPRRPGHPLVGRRAAARRARGWCGGRSLRVRHRAGVGARSSRREGRVDAEKVNVPAPIVRHRATGDADGR